MFTVYTVVSDINYGTNSLWLKTTSLPTLQTYLAFFIHLCLSVWKIISENKPTATITELKEASLPPVYRAWMLL